MLKGRRWRVEGSYDSEAAERLTAGVRAVRGRRENIGAVASRCVSLRWLKAGVTCVSARDNKQQARWAAADSENDERSYQENVGNDSKRCDIGRYRRLCNWQERSQNPNAAVEGATLARCRSALAPVECRKRACRACRLNKRPPSHGAFASTPREISISPHICCHRSPIPAACAPSAQPHLPLLRPHLTTALRACGPVRAVSDWRHRVAQAAPAGAAVSQSFAHLIRNMPTTALGNLLLSTPRENTLSVGAHHTSPLECVCCSFLLRHLHSNAPIGCDLPHSTC